MEQPAIFEDASQEHLPGLIDAGRKLRGPRPQIRRDSPAQIPLMASVREELAEWQLSPSGMPTSQLSIEGFQLELQDSEADPVQLSLFSEPPFWETPDPAASQTQVGRLARKRIKLGITPGQRSLF